MTNTTNIITLEIPEEETAILSCVIRQVSRELEERIADAGKDEPHLTREALDALTLHMEVELGCVNRLAAALEDAVEYKAKEEAFFSGELDPSVDLLDDGEDDTECFDAWNNTPDENEGGGK